MVVAAYGLILPRAVLRTPTLGCVNVHASLLPRWRGAAPIERAMIAGDRTTGITLIAMDERLDTGPMLAAAPCEISDSDTGESLSDRLAARGAALLIDCLDRWNALTPTPQPEVGASYAKKLSSADALIDWRADAALVARTIRALNPRLPAHTWLGPDRVRMLMARVSTAIGHGSPGQILGLDKRALTVACGSGSIDISRVQIARGKGIPIDAEALYNGFRTAFAPGRRFTNRPGEIGVA
jgi:methionyl-tRNA formyltransferase